MPGSAARWLLLACTVISTAIGVAAMHTLGHGTSHTHGASHGAGGGPAAAVAAGVAVIAVAVDECSGCAHAGGSSPGRHDLPAWSICVAVLAAAGAVVLLAWWLDARRGRAGAAVPVLGNGRPAVPRAPPGTLLGLQLSVVSVRRI